MIFVASLDHMEVPGITMPCPTARLHVCYHGAVEIEPYHKVALWNIESLLCYGCGKQAVQFTATKFGDCQNLVP